MTREYGLITNAEHYSLTLMHYLWILVLYIKLGTNRAEVITSRSIVLFLVRISVLP